MFSLPAFLALALLAPWPFASDDDPQAPDPPRIIAWNDLGMHCIDPDFSVFSILPPYNNIHSQLVLNGQLQPGSGYTVTYSAVPDPTGSINRTSIGKTNFWDHVQHLFGTTLPVDVGLAGFAMPGPANVPQPMSFDPAWRWFFAEGLPYTPLDDAFQKNPYPLLEVIAKNQSGQVIASTITTVPNSEELDCRQCHASGSSAFARPSGGWVFDPDPLKDDRFNILRLHDELHLGDPTYQAALATAGYNPAGMFATVKQDGVAILCDRCHASNALPGTGISGIKPLTEVMHGFHASVVNPLGQRLDDITDRSACYSCHPGLDTQCLRGAMGKAIGADGDFQMQCQSCHGNMSTVGLPGRDGWFDEPTCQNCHTGSAVQNAGQIRFTSVYDSPGHRRDAVTNLFATEPDVPILGSSLYRFSEGHGDLQCSACHGPPHAIYPTSEVNDNLQSEQIQGHVGTITECSSCHGDREDDELFGPHGMHPASQDWASGKHGDFAEHNLAQCQACHGIDSRGTELSYAQADRTYSTRFGTKTFFRGARVGCYHCHNGPTSENGINNLPPVVGDLSLSTPNDVPLSIPLSGTDLDGDTLSLRIVSQPETRTGTVAFDGSTATYLPPAGRSEEHT
ncbi:MAG: hypothetical protein RL885_31900, partial [Planctomycetota bacterium]